MQNKSEPNLILGFNGMVVALRDTLFVKEQIKKGKYKLQLNFFNGDYLSLHGSDKSFVVLYAYSLN